MDEFKVGEIIKVQVIGSQHYGIFIKALDDETYTGLIHISEISNDFIKDVSKVSNEFIEKQIITVLEKIRPFLNRDGGDIEFVKFQDGEVFVRMIGACAGCDLIDSTLQDGVAKLLKK